MPVISKDIWITREGHQFEIKDMASSHLLAAIHYIERNRFMNAAETFSEMQLDDKTRMEATNYYLQWPIQYESLIAEAQRRNLIYRKVEGLVKRKK
jgi:hypothetical protein